MKVFFFLDCIVFSNSTTWAYGEEHRPECFPRGATVQLEDGTTITVDKLNVGDRVAVGDGL
jgi:hypothetical protein